MVTYGTNKGVGVDDKCHLQHFEDVVYCSLYSLTDVGRKWAPFDSCNQLRLWL